MKVTKELDFNKFTANINFAFEDGQYILDDQDFELIEARDTFTGRYIVPFQRQKWNDFEQWIFDNQQELFEREFKELELTQEEDYKLSQIGL